MWEREREREEEGRRRERWGWENGERKEKGDRYVL